MPVRNCLDLPDGWTLEEILTVKQIEGIRPIWQALEDAESRPVLESDLERYLSVLKGVGETQPYIFLLHLEDQPRAMVIGRLDSEILPIRLGYKTILRLKLKCFSVVYGGLLGQPDEQVSAMLLHGLAGILRQRKADCVGFNHLPTDSPFYRQISRQVPFLCRNHFPVIDIHWRMEMPETIDAFFQRLSKKHKANLRRTIRNFEEQYQGKIKLIKFDENADIDFLSKDAETISVKTYQHSIDAGFSAGPLTKSILKTDASLNRLMFSLFYVAEQPCAFQWGTVLKDTYFLEKIGYDPQWTQQGIGNILFIKNLEQLCSDSSIKYIDFGFGDAQYKRSSSNESWPEAKKTYLFALRPYPLFVNGLISLNGALTLGLTWVFKKLGVYARIKRVWRGKLKNTNPNS